MMLTRVLLISAEHHDSRERADVADAAEHAAQDRLVSNIEPAVGPKHSDTELIIAVAVSELLARCPASQFGHGMIPRAYVSISATPRWRCGTLHHGGLRR